MSDDRDLLTAIGAETFRDTCAAANTSEDMALSLAQAFGSDQQARELADPSGVFLIATLGEAAVGYARVRWETTQAVAPGRRVLEIARLYVRRPWFGQGVGNALMAACLDEAQQSHCDVAWLAVWERNQGALTFFEKWGFAVVGQQICQRGSDLQRDLVMMRRVGTAVAINVNGNTIAIRPCVPSDRKEIFVVINDAAQAYRGIIAKDRWKDPYMPGDELRSEIDAGVVFWGAFDGEGLVGVMGVQCVEDVALIRHAYTRKASQGRGVGAALLAWIRRQQSQPMLVGTWRAADWAVRFYQTHGFTLTSDAQTDMLLRRYWAVPDRQIEESVVLADARWFALQAEPGDDVAQQVM